MLLLRRTAVLAMALVTTLPLLLGLTAPTAAADVLETSSEVTFTSLLNGERTARGLPALRLVVDLVDVSRRHSYVMASKNSLHHNPNLTTDVTGWLVLSENVGYGGTVERIHQALMDSAGHRANILNKDVTQLGMGAVRDGNGRLWVTQVFRKPDSTKLNEPSYITPASTPAAASGVSSTQWLAEREESGSIVLRSVTGDVGAASTQLLPASATGAPALVEDSQGRLDLLARGNDNKLYLRTRPADSSTFSGWTGLGATISARPTAASWQPGRLDVFVRGTNGAVWHRAQSSPGVWGSWTSLGGSLLPGTGPAATSSGAGRLTVAAVGSDRKVYYRAFSSGRWSPWTSMGGQVTGDVDVASPADGRVVVIAKGLNTAAFAKTLDGTTQSAWVSLGGSLPASPAASATPGSGRTDVVARGKDGLMYRQTQLNGGAWSGWTRVL